MLAEDVVPSRDDRGVAGVLRLAVKVPLRVRGIVAVVRAGRIQREPGIDRFGEVRVQGLPAAGEVGVDRVEARVIRQHEAAGRVPDADADLLPDLDGDGTPGEGGVEPRNHPRRVVRGGVAGDVEGGGEGVEGRLDPVKVAGDAVHRREMAVAARHADVHRAQVQAAEQVVKDRSFVEEVRVHVDLADLLEGRRRGRAEPGEERKQDRQEAEEGAEGIHRVSGGGFQRGGEASRGALCPCSRSCRNSAVSSATLAGWAAATLCRWPRSVLRL